MKKKGNGNQNVIEYGNDFKKCKNIGEKILIKRTILTHMQIRVKV